MKINTKAKIEKACSSDRTRFNINDPWLDASDPTDIRLVATNGHMMCALRIDLDGDDPESLSSGYIPLDAIKASRKCHGRMTVEAEHVIVNDVRYPRPTHVFPAWRMVLPTTEPQPLSYMTFDVKLLADLIAACGGVKQAVLRAADNLSPIKVDVCGEPDAIAVLMPMRL